MNDVAPRPPRAKLVVLLVLPLALLGFASQGHGADGDTTADRVLGQIDFTHATDPSFIRARSLNIDGDPRGNGVAIDVAHNPSAIYVVDVGSNRVLGWHDVAAFADGADADLVIGAPDFYTGSQGCQRTPTAFCTPFTVAVDPAGALYVGGDHVEKFDAPFAQGPPVSGTAFVNNGTDPWGVAVDAQGNVYVAFRNQSMVLEYDAGSTTPHLVFGQASASGGSCNQAGFAAATTLCAPHAVAVDAAGSLYVADTFNNRVLVYNTPLNPASGKPGAGDTVADLVIGQSGFTGVAVDTSATGVWGPKGLVVDSHGDLYVADTGNSRVTEYDAPLSDGAAATLVIGQPDATSGGCNQGATVAAGTLCHPTGAAVDASGNLYVYDVDNDRVVAYPESDPPRTKVATRVLGQHDLLHATRNFVDATTVNPTAIAIDRGATPNHLYVVDAVNNRVLGYQDAATFADGGAADLVLGQPDFFSNALNGGGSVNANVLALNSFGREGIAVDSQGNAWVSDPGNRRAVGYAAPFGSGMTQNQPATKVLGEPNLTTAAGGIGCTPMQTSTCAPQGLTLDAADNLYLVDSESQRILEFDTPWSFAGTPPQAASLVFGQGSTGGNFAGGGCNQGGESADSLCGPFGLAVDAHGNLYVADSTNQRVLEYDKPLPFGGGTPGTPGAAGDVTADLVFGQAGSFSTGDCNHGGLLGTTTLCAPAGVSIDPFGSLFVSDAVNNRIVGYTEPANPPTNVTASLEFGQGAAGNDFIHNGANAGGLSASSLSINQFNRFPGVATDSAGNLYVADVGNTRLVEYDGGFLGAPVPTTTTTTTSSSTTTTTHPSTTTTTASTTTTHTTTTMTTMLPSTTSTTTTTASTTTSTTLVTVPPPTSCPDAAATAAVEASIEAQCDCHGARNHGTYVHCAKQVAKSAVKAGTLSAACKNAVVTCAGRSVCGKPGFVTCCRTSTRGTTKCSIKSSPALCKPMRHGAACVGQRASCCDACIAGGCAAAGDP